jgi:phenylacetate-CoA ligase
MNLASRLLNTARVAALARRERTLPFWSPERIARRQTQRVRAIVEHAYTSVPFYTESMRERRLTPRDIRSADDLALLPLIDSAIVRADERRFLSSHVPPSARRALMTSGSHNGHRGETWWDNDALLQKLAYLERDRAVIGRLLGRMTGHRQLYLLPHGAQSFILRDWWTEWTVTPKRLATRIVEPAESSYEQILARVRAERADVVYSYGSLAEHFAQWLAVRGDRLDTPRVWCYGGDGMSEPARALLERQTGTLVYSTYQSSETGRLGFECERRSGWHLNVDLCAVRIVDADGATLPDESEGEVVVSNLHNRASVLLNFRLGDRAVMAGTPCGCGRGLPVLRALLGRHTEVVHLADGRALSGLVLQATCMDALAGALASQLVPESAGHATLRVVTAPGVDIAEMERRVHAVIDERFGDGLSISIEPVSSLATSASGKFARVVHSRTPEMARRR